MNKESGKITAVSRESTLAVIQSRIILDELEKNGYDTELLTMKTTGDKILDRTLDKIGGKGLFVKELDKALIDAKADIAVHSLKDVPMHIRSDIPIIAYSKREAPFDVLVLPEGIDYLDKAKPIGCASKRRTLQLKRLYPDMDIKPVRGNVQTRLRKLDDGEYSALVLALAGLKRLGLEKRVSRVFTADEIIPSCGQGIIAVQGRRDKAYDFISIINDEKAQICAETERAFAAVLGGGCSSPIAGYAEIENDEIFIRGLYADDDMNNVRTGHIRGKVQYAVSLAKELADRLKGRR